MADTYAFALGGALLLALTVSPVLCLLFFRGLKESRDNAMVRWLTHGYLRQLEVCLNHRIITLSVFAALAVGTAWLLPHLGGEFMPELEEGNLYIRGTFPVNASLDEVAGKVRIARGIMRQYPEVLLVASQVGRPDDGTDPSGFYNAEFHVPLRPEKDWPQDLAERKGLWRWLFGAKRARTKAELTDAMRTELNRKLLGVDWGFSQYIRDNVTECLSGVKGDNSVKIFGPDLEKLEQLAVAVKNRLEEKDANGQPKVRGLTDIGVFRIKGQSNLELGIDREKCKLWGISVADVQNAIKTAVGGQALTQMTEGEKTFDITLRWPEQLRIDLDRILDIPVDVGNNTVTQGGAPTLGTSPVLGAATGPAPTGNASTQPTGVGSQNGGTINNVSASPRRLLRDLVTPVNEDGLPDRSPGASFLRPGASTISREQGQRLIAIKFSVKDRDLAGTVADAKAAIADLVQAPYRTEWSGEFQEMEEALVRLMVIIPLSLMLIFLMLYLAFHSLPDVLAVLSNVIALSLGGIWALYLTGTHFSISAAVGFISIFGVAIMDGLLLISYFNHMRAQGMSLREAIMHGAEKRVRPVMMTALTAIFGLLPAAVSTRIGSQTQQPLAIVVVGGMVTTLLLTRYLMPVLYSFYGHREPIQGASNMAH
jgi:cobalt-zinc-cadmium resistance protein CzcA